MRSRFQIHVLFLALSVWPLDVARGHLVAFKKDDGTQIGSIELAIMKARTAVLFLRPTEDMENALHAGKTMIASLPNVLPAGGGVPIIVNGIAIGAIGLSGGEGETDARLAEAAVSFTDLN